MSPEWHTPLLLIWVIRRYLKLFITRGSPVNYWLPSRALEARQHVIELNLWRPFSASVHERGMSAGGHCRSWSEPSLCNLFQDWANGIYECPIFKLVAGTWFKGRQGDICPIALRQLQMVLWTVIREYTIKYTQGFVLFVCCRYINNYWWIHGINEPILFSFERNLEEYGWNPSVLKHNKAWIVRITLRQHFAQTSHRFQSGCKPPNYIHLTDSELM